MNACPDCDKPLAQTATSCACGWTLATSTDSGAYRCAHCDHIAMARVQIGERWENVCDTHYSAHFTALAADSLPSRGLDRKPGESSVEWRKRLTAWLKANAVVKRFAA